MKSQIAFRALNREKKDEKQRQQQHDFKIIDSHSIDLPRSNWKTAAWQTETRSKRGKLPSLCPSSIPPPLSLHATGTDTPP